MRAANHAALYFKRRAGNRVRPTLPRAPPCLVRHPASCATLPRAPHPATAPLRAAALQPPGLQRRC
jgi:hypothetical protein